MPGASNSSCGIYCLRDLRNRTEPRPPLRGYSAPGNPPTCAGLRPSRFPRVILPLSDAWQGFLTARATVSSITDLAPASRSARAPKHPVSPQLSIHDLPVKRVHCQLDCPEVWQKRHALTPIVPPDSALAYPVAPACA